MIYFKYPGKMIGFAILIISINACTTNVTQINRNASNLNDVEALLDKAQRSEPSQQAFYLLKASRLLLEQNNDSKALEILELLSLENLQPQYRDQYHSLYAYSLAKDFPENSLKQLKLVQQIDAQDDETQYYYFQAGARSHFALENGIETFRHAIKIPAFQSDDQAINASYQLAWQGLMLLDPRNLEAYQSTFYELNEKAWLELALAYKQYAIDAERLLSALKSWRLNYPEHPANTYIPKELQLADQAQPYDVSQIALLLPSNGPYANMAKTLRDGFISAHLNNNKTIKPSIKIYDTTEVFSAVTLYEQAIAEGANFVVGPLTKSKIEEIVNYYTEVPVPTLVLNRMEKILRADNHFYQFGLPVEDEARQVAIRAFNDGRRDAVVLVPETAKGERATKSFVDEFTSLGGQIATKMTYKPKEDPQNVVMSLLGVDKSETRKNTLRYLLDQDLKFEARRRQDIDFVFLVSSFRDAQRIKPFFDRYFAADLQIYATSDLYTGLAKSRNNKELNGIIFCDIPWLVQPDELMQSQKKLIAELWPRATQRQARLYALGFDAYQMIPDLSKLRALPLYRLAGLSGNISVNNKGWVIRELNWAIFKGETIQALKK